MKNRAVKIANKTGLHARPASVFVKTATKFASDVYIEFNENRINAKSIINVLSAGILCGSEINIIAKGSDEAEAVDVLVKLVESNFGE